MLTGADLSVTQFDSPDPVNVANNMSYSLFVANGGPEAATGVTLTDTLPAGVTFQSASATQGSCSESGGTVTCLLGDLANRSAATVNIAVTAPVVTGTITNTASVSGNETDAITGNNTDSENTTVVNLNINQLCYLVADAGGGNGGNDLFTSIDTADFNPATNETSIGSGTGTNSDRSHRLQFRDRGCLCGRRRPAGHAKHDKWCFSSRCRRRLEQAAVPPATLTLTTSMAWLTTRPAACSTAHMHAAAATAISFSRST